MSSQEKAYAHLAESVYGDILGYTRAVISERDQLRAEVEADDRNLENMSDEINALCKELAELRKVDHPEQVLDMVQPKADPVQEPHAWLHDEHQGWVVRMPPPDTGEGRWYPIYTAAPNGMRKAAQMALEALDSKWHCMQTGDIDAAIKALRKELGQ
jgi:hypothetical protein